MELKEFATSMHNPAYHDGTPGGRNEFEVQRPRPAGTKEYPFGLSPQILFEASSALGVEVSILGIGVPKPNAKPGDKVRINTALFPSVIGIRGRTRDPLSGVLNVDGISDCRLGYQKARDILGMHFTYTERTMGDDRDRASLRMQFYDNGRTGSLAFLPGQSLLSFLSDPIRASLSARSTADHLSEVEVLRILQTLSDPEVDVFDYSDPDTSKRINRLLK